jgi:hypothetical protein
VILVHDSFYPGVRAGLEAASPQTLSKVVGLDLDFVPGRMAKSGLLAGQLCCGFALVLVDDRPSPRTLPTVEVATASLDPMPLELHDAYETVRRAAPVVAHRGAPSVEQLERELESMRSSWSWRITAPLRALKARLRRLTRRA